MNNSTEIICIFIAITLDMGIILGRTAIFTLLSLPIHECITLSQIFLKNFCCNTIEYILYTIPLYIVQEYCISLSLFEQLQIVLYYLLLLLVPCKSIEIEFLHINFVVCDRLNLCVSFRKLLHIH